MKIFSAMQMRQWDQFTIAREPISSIALMERAARACFDWMDEHGYLARPFSVFCGKGNNGGDGLAIARMLIQAKAAVTVYILESRQDGSPDFQRNLLLLAQEALTIHYLDDDHPLPPLPHSDIIIECLFGTGLSRPLAGPAARLVQFINESGCEIISIDIPAGLSADQSSIGHTVVKAAHTLSFQTYKTAFLVAENEQFTGQVQVLDIGLHPGFCEHTNSRFKLTDVALIHSVYKPRNRFAHKGSFGHALIMAGSDGKMGAAVMAATACLRSGAGLLTVQTPSAGNLILQIALPEAMTLADPNSHILSQLPDDLEKFAAIGIGPSIGTAPETVHVLTGLLESYQRPIVVDADALNILAAHPALLPLLPPGSILTPHPKEFERLFGKHNNDFERLDTALIQAANLHCVIVLKGHHTFIALPDGSGYFNNTGNPGMAKGGSGDVLTGILTGLLAQGYTAAHAAVMGVHLHGLAGDLAATELGPESMLPTDLIMQLGNAFRSISALQ
jgi:hydroxyethylthiazole kinase-like uncharacterized protein yjeF